MFLRLNLIFMLLGAVLTGCGYHFSSVQTQLPGNIKRVAIPTFANATKEAGIESVFTSELRKEFYKSKVVEVVDSDRAQGIIRGNIKEISVDSTAYSEEDLQSRGAKLLAREYGVRVVADIELYSTTENRVIWSRTVNDLRRYSADKNLLQNETRQRQAYAKVASYLMEQVHDMLFENF